MPHLQGLQLCRCICSSHSASQCRDACAALLRGVRCGVQTGKTVTPAPMACKKGLRAVPSVSRSLDGRHFQAHAALVSSSVPVRSATRLACMRPTMRRWSALCFAGTSKRVRSSGKYSSAGSGGAAAGLSP